MKLYTNRNENVIEKLESMGVPVGRKKWVELTESQANSIAVMLIAESMGRQVRVDAIEGEILDGEEKFGYELLWLPDFRVYTIRGYAESFDGRNWDVVEDETALVYDSLDAACLGLSCLEVAINTWKTERMAELAL